MLREARIVMPHFNTTLSDATHHTLRKQLCEAFGGFTVFSGQGGWFNGAGVVHDNVMIYDIAIDNDRDAPFDLLHRFAVEAGRALDQQSVYLRYPNGEVDIVDLEKESAAASSVAATLDRDRVLLDALTAGFTVVSLPGELWETVAGAKVFVGNRFSRRLDGGWYVTVVDSGPTHDRVMFEYVVNHDGKVLPALPGEVSPRDLKRRVHRHPAP